MTSVRENQDRWLAALRSGKYKQGQKVLHAASGEMCCLGVACVLFRDEQTSVRLSQDKTLYIYDEGYAIAPTYVCNALGIDMTGSPEDETSGKLKPLAGLNDSGKSFAEIADIFEANREAYTKKGEL